MTEEHCGTEDGGCTEEGTLRVLLAGPGATRVHLELPSVLLLEGQQARRFGGSIRRVGGQPLAGRSRWGPGRGCPGTPPAGAASPRLPASARLPLRLPSLVDPAALCAKEDAEAGGPSESSLGSCQWDRELAWTRSPRQGRHAHDPALSAPSKLPLIPGGEGAAHHDYT